MRVDENRSVEMCNIGLSSFREFKYNFSIQLLLEIYIDKNNSNYNNNNKQFLF